MLLFLLAFFPTTSPAQSSKLRVTRVDVAPLTIIPGSPDTTENRAVLSVELAVRLTDGLGSLERRADAHDTSFFVECEWQVVDSSGILAFTDHVNLELTPPFEVVVRPDERGWGSARFAVIRAERSWDGRGPGGEFVDQGNYRYSVSAVFKRINALGNGRQKTKVIASAGPLSGELEILDPVAPVVIASVSPDRGDVGTVVSLFGEGFAEDPTRIAAFLNDLECPVVATSAGELTVLIPKGAATGSIRVVSGSAESNRLDFEVDALYRFPELDVEDAERGFALGRVILEYVDGQLQDEVIDEINASYGIRGQQYHADLGYYIAFLADASASNTSDVADRLGADPRVLWAITDGVSTLTCDRLEINDEIFPRQLHLDEDFLNVRRGFEVFFPRMGEGIRIAIIDSGVDMSSRDLNVVQSIDLATGQTTAMDDDGHGTAVATLAAGRINNQVCGVGVAPKAEIIAIKITRGDYTIHSVLAQAIRRAVDYGARVVNISLGDKVDALGPIRCAWLKLGISDLAKALDYAQSKNVIVVGSAGNNDGGWIDFPACDDQIIAVGSIDAAKRRSSFSDTGPELEFVALGEQLWTDLFFPSGSGPDCGVTDMGTSFAAPQVSGLAALILAEDPALSPNEVKGLMVQHYVEDLGRRGRDHDTGFGAIRVNAYDLGRFNEPRGSVVEGGQEFFPEVEVGPPGYRGGPEATLEFYVNDSSLGSLKITRPGDYRAPEGIQLRNLIGMTDVFEFRAVLTQGSSCIELKKTVPVVFSPSNAFHRVDWHVAFEWKQTLSGRTRTRSGSGILAADSEQSTITMTVTDSRTNDSRTCTYMGRIPIFFRFTYDDIFAPEFYVFRMALERCLPSFSRYTPEYDIVDLANPSTEIVREFGECVISARLTFDASNVSAIELSRVGCQNEELIMLTRVVPGRYELPSKAGMDTSAGEKTGIPLELRVSSPVLVGSSVGIAYSLPTSRAVDLRVYDVRGRLIRTLVEQQRGPGSHEVVWDGLNALGTSVPSGVYYVHLVAPPADRKGRIIVLK